MPKRKSSRSAASSAGQRPRSAGERSQVSGAKRRVSHVRVVVVFVSVFLALDALILTAHAREAFTQLMAVTAIIAGSLTQVTGLPVTVVDNQIYLASRILVIDLDCTAIMILAVYTALVLASAVRWRMRMIALLVGLPLIASANIARLVAVAHASERLPANAFYFAHDYLFQVSMVVVVLILWVGWLSYVGNRAAA